MTATESGSVVTLTNGSMMLLPGWQMHLSDMAKDNHKNLDRLLERARLRNGG